MYLNNIIMRFILLFLNLFLVYSFRNTLFSKIQSFIHLKDSTTNECNNIYFSGSVDSPSSNNLDVNPDSYVNKKEEPLEVILSRQLNKMRREYGGGFDQRDIGKTCLEKIYDQVQEKKTLDKLRKYSYQMNLLKKLENSQVGDFEKIREIEQYNYLMESSKYISNIESGGLYKNWTNNDF